MAVALTALFVALGGTGYAATQLPGTHDVQSTAKKKKKNTTVFGVKQATTLFQRLFAVADDSGKDLTGLNAYLAVTPVPNAKHASSADSATTATTATTATNAGHATNSDQLGGTAASSYVQFGQALPTGVSESGVWGGGYHASTIGDEFIFLTSFALPLAADLDATHVILVPGASTTHCPGVGSADSGYLCAYVQTSGHTTGGGPFRQDGVSGAGKFGFAVTETATATGFDFLTGAYTVTG